MEENKKIRIKRSYIVIFCLIAVVLVAMIVGRGENEKITPETIPEQVVETVEIKEVIREEALGAEEELDAEIETNRDEMIKIFKENALANWGDDYRMVKYEVEEQTKAYDWIVKQTEYPDIMAKAKQNWGNDYRMVRYEYKQQVEAYESL